MSEYSGLEKLTPAIIKYPFKKLLNAFINLRLGRKILPSIVTIFAAILGCAVGYIFPGIGSLMAFFLNLFIATPVNSAIIAGVSIVVSSILAASLFIYITKEIFKSYYISKYGVADPEMLFSAKDRNKLTIIFTEDGYLEKEVKSKINEIEQRIVFLVDKIRMYEMIDDSERKKTAKFAIAELKRGNMSMFLDMFEDDYIKKQKRLDKLRKKPVVHRKTDSDSDIEADNNHDASDAQDLFASNSEYIASDYNYEDDQDEDNSKKRLRAHQGQSSTVVRNAQTNGSNTVNLQLTLYGIKPEEIAMASSKANKNISGQAKETAIEEVNSEEETLEQRIPSGTRIIVSTDGDASASLRPVMSS